jgi:hypothetical protein
MTRESLDWAPSSCALPTVERPLREREFDDLFASSLLGAVRTSPTTAELTLTRESVSQARDLAERETSCCSFFSFDVREAGDAGDAGAEVAMSITVPSMHAAVLEALVDSAGRAAGLEVTTT